MSFRDSPFRVWVPFRVVVAFHDVPVRHGGVPRSGLSVRVIETAPTNSRGQGAGYKSGEILLSAVAAVAAVVVVADAVGRESSCGRSALVVAA